MQQDSRRRVLSGPAIAVRGDDIDTDRIVPARYLRTVTFEGLGSHAFEDDRLQLKAEGQIHPFDQAEHAQATILIVNKNFGCGSSREHAPQALARWGRGLSAIVGESFAEIFYSNCLAIGVPCIVLGADSIQSLMNLCERAPSTAFSVDLEQNVIRAGDLSYATNLPAGVRQSFLEGTWDSTAELLANLGQVQQTAAKLPYVAGFRA